MHALPRLTSAAICLLFSLDMGLPTVVAAKDADPAENAYLEAVRACQPITEPNQRLACYDKAVGDMVAATEQGELQMVDRAQVRDAKRKLFGFSLPDFGIFGGGKDKAGETVDEVDEVLVTTIASVRSGRDGNWILTTAEGAVWELAETPRRLMTPRVGQSLELRKAALGSYFIRINGQGGVRGKRIG